MKIIEQISDFLNPLKVDISLYRAISELVITKIKVPQLSIRAAKKWVSAINHHGEFGEWGFAVCKDPKTVEKLIKKVCEV